MSTASPDSPTDPDPVRAALLAGGRRLIEREARPNLSVRRLAGAAGRSTMCVYSHFGNRTTLISALHDERASELRRALDDSEAPTEAARAWIAANPLAALWLLTAQETEEVQARAAQLREELRERLSVGGSDGESGLESMIGRLVLDGVVSIQDAAGAAPSGARARGREPGAG